MKTTTIIHPADPSTEFLRALYPEGEVSRITEKESGKRLRHILGHAESLLLLGHGTEEGLLAPDSNGNPFGRVIISGSHRYYLRRMKEIIGIWCNANIFAYKLGIHGLFSGMMISELSEAQELGIPTTQEELDRENILWAQRLGDLLREGVSLRDIPEVFRTLDTSRTPLTKFNYQNIEYI